MKDMQFFGQINYLYFISVYKPAVGTLLILTFTIFEVGSIFDFAQLGISFEILSMRDFVRSGFFPFGILSVWDFVQFGICYELKGHGRTVETERNNRVTW